MKKRIWELDFARGAALLGMMIIHLIYDLVDLFGVLNWQLPQWYLVFDNGGNIAAGLGSASPWAAAASGGD